MIHVGHINDDVAYNGETDKVDCRKIKVKCPGCERVGAPLCSSKTESDGGGFVGCPEMEDYHAHYKTQCRCGQRYRFTVVADC